MRKKLLVALVTVALLGLIGCQSDDASDGAQRSKEENYSAPTSSLEETNAPVPTPTATNADIFKYEIVDNAIVITGLKEEQKHIVIPSEIEGIPVTSIGERAFRRCNNLISVEIPDSVTRIEKCAFERCENLVSIEIPNSVTYIGAWAFSDCKSLESVKIPKSVKEIGVVGGGNDLFSGCENLKVIAVEDNSYAKTWARKDDFPVDVYYYSSSREAGVSSEQETNVSDTETLSERVGGKLYVGDEFTLGTYEQDNYLDNGKEPIEWIVYSKNDDFYMCISKYVLDWHVFSDDEETEIPNRWNESDMRKWLNGTFYNEAFSDIEKENLVSMDTRYSGWKDKSDLVIDRITSYDDYVRLIGRGELDEHPGCVKVTEFAKEHQPDDYMPYVEYVIDDGTREHENCCHVWAMMNLSVESVESLKGIKGYDNWNSTSSYAEYIECYIHGKEKTGDCSVDTKFGVRPVIKIQLNNY